MTFWVSVSLLVFLVIATAVIERIWRHRVERLRHKADYPLEDRYPPPQASAEQKWPWV